jgi:hypothetical protein
MGTPLAHDPEKPPDFSDENMRKDKKLQGTIASIGGDPALAHFPTKGCPGMTRDGHRFVVENATKCRM